MMKSLLLAAAFLAVPACTLYEPEPTPYLPPTTGSGGITRAIDAGGAATCGTTAGVRLQVPELLQQCPEWCWAATITMVSSYFGKPIDECTLASAKSGFGGCCNGVACGIEVCNQPGSDAEITMALGQLGMQVHYQAARITEDALVNELRHGRPVIVGYRAPFSGHVAVISGFSTGPDGTRIFHVADPWPDFGAFDAPYATIANGPNMPWAITWTGLTTAAPPACE